MIESEVRRVEFKFGEGRWLKATWRSDRPRVVEIADVRCRGREVSLGLNEIPELIQALGRVRQVAGLDPTEGAVMPPVEESVTSAGNGESEVAEDVVGEPDGALVRRVTRAVREADGAFEDVGGSSRHWVRECFFPALRSEGLAIVVASDYARLVEAARDVVDWLDASTRGIVADDNLTKLKLEALRRACGFRGETESESEGGS